MLVEEAVQPTNPNNALAELTRRYPNTSEVINNAHNEDSVIDDYTSDVIGRHVIGRHKLLAQCNLWKVITLRGEAPAE